MGHRTPESFPALLRAGEEASRYAYNHITANASGHALAQIAMGRRSVTVTGAITDHARRFSRTLEAVLRNPKARAELRELLDSYET